MPLWREKSFLGLYTKGFSYTTVCFSVIQGKDLFFPLSSLFVVVTDHMTTPCLLEHKSSNGSYLSPSLSPFFCCHVHDFFP